MRYLFAIFKLSHKIQTLNYLSNIQTLGDHLLAGQLDKKLLQKDVSKIIGVSEETVHHWEKNYTDPEARYYPKIMEFLDYCPIRYAHNFGQQLMLHRTHRGYSQKGLGKVLNIDPATISRWETTNRMPYKKHRDRLEEFFNSDHWMYLLKFNQTNYKINFDWLKMAQIDDMESSLICLGRIGRSCKRISGFSTGCLQMTT